METENLLENKERRHNYTYDHAKNIGPFFLAEVEFFLIGMLRF